MVPWNQGHVLLYQTLKSMSGIQHNKLLCVSRFLSFIILKSWAQSFDSHPEGCLSLSRILTANDAALNLTQRWCEASPPVQKRTSILAIVLWEPALMKGCCFSPPSNHILRVHVGKRKGGWSEGKKSGIRILSEGKHKISNSSSCVGRWRSWGLTGLSPLISVARSLLCERERHTQQTDCANGCVSVTVSGWPVLWRRLRGQRQGGGGCELSLGGWV